MWMITYDAHKFHAAEIIMAFDFFYSYRCTVVSLTKQKIYLEIYRLRKRKDIITDLYCIDKYSSVRRLCNRLHNLYSFLIFICRVEPMVMAAHPFYTKCFPSSSTRMTHHCFAFLGLCLLWNVCSFIKLSFDW